MTADEIARVIEQAAARHGVPATALMAIADIESSGNIGAQNPRSSASGLFQFVDTTAKEYGLTGSKRNDPVAQADAAAKMMATNARSLEGALGRPASAGELYLAHQQGLGGARALLTNPGRPAIDVLTNVYGSREKAARAIQLNGGSLNQSAGQFAGQWVNKANQRVAMIPPGSVPNVVGSQLDTTPQTRNVPLPKPRPAVRQSAEESVRPYLTSDMQVRGDNLPQLAPAQITPGLGSLTPDFFKTPAPPKRLPDIGSTSSPVGPGPTSLASVQDMYGRPQTNRLDPIGLGPLSLANVQGMYGRGGVGLPPATRSVPSIPVRPAMNAIGTMPSFGQFQAQFGRQIGFPTPVSQRPPQQIGFPPPANIRPSMAMAQPQRPPLQVTVQGANSYNAPQPQTFAGTSSGRSYTAGQRYTMGGDTYVANPDGSFTNTRTGRRLAGSSGGQSSQRSSSGPAQSLV